MRFVRVSNSVDQPRSQAASRLALVSCSLMTNSASRFRSGFSPSEVRKSRQREERLPATCLIMAAILLENSPGLRKKSLSACTWANALSAHSFCLRKQKVISSRQVREILMRTSSLSPSGLSTGQRHEHVLQVGVRSPDAGALALQLLSGKGIFHQ